MLGGNGPVSEWGGTVVAGAAVARLAAAAEASGVAPLGLPCCRQWPLHLRSWWRRLSTAASAAASASTLAPTMATSACTSVAVAPTPRPPHWRWQWQAPPLRRVAVVVGPAAAAFG